MRRWRQIETCARVFDCESLGNWHHMKVRLKMAEKLGFFETGSLVDVGCGRGRYLSYFIERYGIPFCVGLDISMKAVRDAKELLKGQSCVDFVVADAENLPFKDSSFDFVFSTDVVEHLHDPSKGVKEMVRVSRDKIVIATPNKLCPIDMSRVARVLTHHHPPSIERYLTKFQLNEMLQCAGLRRENILIRESSFFPLGWLLVHVKLKIPNKIFRMLLLAEDILEKTPLRHIAGVIIACCQKSQNLVKGDIRDIPSPSMRIIKFHNFLSSVSR